MQNIIEWFTTLRDINVTELLAYILILVFICVVLATVVRKRSKKVIRTIIISVVYVVLLVTISVLCIVFMSKQDNYTLQTETEVDTEQVIVDTEDEVETFCFTTTTEYYTTQAGFVHCVIYTSDDLEITAADLLCDTNFCNSVEVTEDEAVAGKYNVVYSQFTTDGSYTITVRDTECRYTINIVSEVSDNLTMTCTASATEVQEGDTITLLLEYSGVDVTTNTASLLYNDGFVVLRNCVGNVQSNIQSSNVVCITLTDIGILNSKQEASIEIMQGTMVDSKNLPVNGTTIMLNFVE